MRELTESYGKKAYDEWCLTHPDDLKRFQTSPSEANSDDRLWDISSFRELIAAVSFLNAMNRRLVLFFRGQAEDRDPVPALFRDQWSCFEKKFQITPATRGAYWTELIDLGPLVYEICKNTKSGLPRFRDLRDVRESQWAVIQHYGLWPTPLIDITSSVKVAASFALQFRPDADHRPKDGYVYVVGLPHSTGSISIDVADRLCLARLQSVCPPSAKRPHYQDGFLVGRYPLYGPAATGVVTKSRLSNRLVAKFRLHDSSDFWDEDFPIVRPTALLPPDDELLDAFTTAFGPNGQHSLLLKASKLH